MTAVAWAGLVMTGASFTWRVKAWLVGPDVLAAVTVIG